MTDTCPRRASLSVDDDGARGVVSAIPGYAAQLHSGDDVLTPSGHDQELSALSRCHES